jgi:CDGSH-type Zn-finger protein
MEPGNKSAPEPRVLTPFRADVSDGKTYWWCACGRSAKQPYCDGSHRGTTFTPLAYKADDTITVALCGCKHTQRPPFCDGSHVRAQQERAK